MVRRSKTRKRFSIIAVPTRLCTEDCGTLLSTAGSCRAALS